MGSPARSAPRAPPRRLPRVRAGRCGAGQPEPRPPPKRLLKTSSCVASERRSSRSCAAHPSCRPRAQCARGREVGEGNWPGRGARRHMGRGWGPRASQSRIQRPAHRCGRAKAATAFKQEAFQGGQTRLVQRVGGVCPSPNQAGGSLVRRRTGAAWPEMRAFPFNLSRSTLPAAGGEGRLPRSLLRLPRLGRSGACGGRPSRRRPRGAPSLLEQRASSAARGACGRGTPPAPRRCSAHYSEESATAGAAASAAGADAMCCRSLRPPGAADIAAIAASCCCCFCFLMSSTWRWFQYTI